MYCHGKITADTSAGSLTLVPDGSFEGHAEKRVDHCIPQNRISILGGQISEHGETETVMQADLRQFRATDMQVLYPYPSSAPSSPHCCSALEDDQASTGVPPRHDSTSPIGYFRLLNM